ncbi:MAG: hypothetical protein K0R73_98 [Candidatus Midichloriaceae bacterium]|jgi:hypothetical protein|nr:hypothetical protein [Candidatus Midichloriaceae bacterium]
MGGEIALINGFSIRLIYKITRIMDKAPPKNA